MEPDRTSQMCSLNKAHLICKSPIKLPCKIGESDVYACLACIVARIDYMGLFKCANCHTEHKLDSNQLTEFNLQEKDLKHMSTKLVQNLKEKIKQSPSSHSMTGVFDYIEYEIDLRVESLKIELDLMRIKLNNTLERFQTSQNFLTDKNRHQIEELTIQIDRNKNKSFLGNQSLVGYLKGPLKQFNLKSGQGKVEFIDLRRFVRSACGLTEMFYFNEPQRYKLAITDFAANDIKLLDRYESHLLQELTVTSISKVKELKFKKFYAICNSSESSLVKDDHSVYLCDMELHRVLIFDLKLDRLKRIVYGTGKSGKLEFECPRDVCYWDNRFYVLDQGTYSVDQFTHDGDFLESFFFNQHKGIKLIENPWSVRVNNDRMAIIDWKQKIFIFDSAQKLVHTIQQDLVVSICFVNNLQLFAHSENGDLKAYQVGNEGEASLNYEVTYEKLKYASEFMISAANQRLILSLGWTKALAIVDIEN